MHDMLHILPPTRVNAVPAASATSPVVANRSSKLGARPLQPAADSKRQQQQKLGLTRSFVSRLIRNTNAYVLSFRDGLTPSEREDRHRTDERKQILGLRMKNAETFSAWEAAASELDQLEGNDEWKLDPVGTIYNPRLILSRLAELDEARYNVDIGAMMYLVRTALSRDLGGMGNPELYRHSHIGSKRLIEQYVESAVSTIQALVEKSGYPGALPAGLEHQDLLDGVLYARQSFGRSALLLSGGGTFGMMHIGVVKGMFEAKLLPRIISGASAGSIVCSVLCSTTDDEIPVLLAQFPYGDLAVFEDVENPPGFLGHLRRLLIEGSWNDIGLLTKVMRGLLGDITFQEAYNRTRRICNICVSSASIFDTPRLLNYVTSPNILLWSAVAASCSVPMIFQGSQLLIKDPVTGEHRPWDPTPTKWIDGSVDNDLPMTRLAELFNVNHFIVSQVNPHVVPFLEDDGHPHSNASTARPVSNGLLSNPKIPPSQTQGGWMTTLSTLAMEEALHRLYFLAEINLFSNTATKLRSVLSQKYSGDINILPEIALKDLPKLLKNPTSEFMVRACLAGERATWPRLSRIRDRCAIELALDRAVHALRARVVFSESQKDLRRLFFGSEEPSSGFKETSADAFAPRKPTSATSGGSLANNTGPPYRGPSPVGKTKPRQRLLSGSGIQLLARHRRVLQNLEDALTDEETEEEERLAMNLQRAGSGLGLAQSGGASHASNITQLKRAARSHGGLASMIHRVTGIGGGGGARTGPVFVPGVSDRNGVDGFDFSQPMKGRPASRPPPDLPHEDSDDKCPNGDAGDHDEDLHLSLGSARTPTSAIPAVILPVSPTSPELEDVFSPTDEPSDIDPGSSDGYAGADGDSNTDQSRPDPDPYDRAAK